MLHLKENQPLSRAFTECSAAICMAADQKYLPYAAVVISSILRNGDPNRQYDILLLSRDMTEESRCALELLADGYRRASVRIVDMESVNQWFDAGISSYYSAETNYRLLIMSELLAEYERVIYIDCDTVVLQDILQLAETDMKGYPLAACRDYSMHLKQYSQSAVFYGQIPYSVENYCREVLGLEGYEDYFNAGVAMFDTARCRQMNRDVHTAVQMLQNNNYVYNDQDVLNIMFEHQFCNLDTGWNYINDYEKYLSYPPAVKAGLYQKVHREKPAVVHYIGGRKPWNYAPLPLEHLFWREADALEKRVPAWRGRYPRPERRKQAKSSVFVCRT